MGLGDNEWLFGELKRGNAVEAPTATKRRNLEARPATADVGRAVALGSLEEEVARLVALERELWEKAARLATADVGRAVASGTLKEGVARLVALERELREKPARLAGQRHRKRSKTLRPRTWCFRARRGSRSGCGPLPRTSWRGTR